MKLKGSSLFCIFISAAGQYRSFYPIYWSFWVAIISSVWQGNTGDTHTIISIHMHTPSKCNQFLWKPMIQLFWPSGIHFWKEEEDLSKKCIFPLMRTNYFCGMRNSESCSLVAALDLLSFWVSSHLQSSLAVRFLRKKLEKEWGQSTLRWGPFHCRLSLSRKGGIHCELCSP